MAYTKVLQSIPESYFGKTMGRKLEVGTKPLINMAVGIPDKPVPDTVLQALTESIQNPKNNKYGVFRGKATLKSAIKTFYKEVYDVELDPDKEICILYGTKSGLVHLPTCVIEPGEGVLLPNPGYTDYLAGVKLARGEHYELKLYPENNYLPDFDQVVHETLENTKLIYLNYPSNPTGAVATRAFFDETIERFAGTDTRIVHDFAYAAFGFDSKNPSILQSPGAKDIAIEIYSLSKGFNMSGVRVGFAVGNAEIIENLNYYQDHTQVGMWGAIQDGATAALNLGETFLNEQSELFRKRRDKVCAALKQADIPFHPMQGGIFLWVKVPPEFKSESYVDFLLKSQSILVTPGIPFGSLGDDYIRVSLAVEDAALDEFIQRIVETNVLYE
ncbi:aminotransferase class I/II-fold pyridoxal phosphate-dependent enzyme [Macrococcoides caseolyticum]|uniref:aminotransferase class I/II-fold pyridoxal phosphate-dependent enzyme n=1 Tax=Macrococcoides caseolyticum TaxID=69966 RepID=UPI001F414A47|nr:aminotransferase class I/II-fold pyridoxal phosphate-dependent enzyme [Macrococcus caseolyticus]MCE4956445.1 aminotransferase class I/II-fold pyridoxal phosphate-dependent enzyme [Macrococcus caseolyticus]